MKAKKPNEAGAENIRLTIELVPSTSWGVNLGRLMRRTDWDKLRKQVYAKYRGRCGVCGAENSRLHSHEIWEYDESTHIQRLAGFIALCELCHLVKHIGFAGNLAAEGRLDYEEVVAHFIKVNACDRETFDAQREWAFEQWADRSKHEWRVDFGEYADLVQSSR